MKITLTPEITEPYDIHSAPAGFHRCVATAYGDEYKDIYIVHKESKDCREVIVYWTGNHYPSVRYLAQMDVSLKYLPVTKPFDIRITP